ncbi:MAG TPA: hypothetical protein VF898_07570 [Chloroflexota bacterium]
MTTQRPYSPPAEDPQQEVPCSVHRTPLDMVETEKTVLQREQRRGGLNRFSPESPKLPSSANEELLFLADQKADGSYVVTLTEEGVERFETALAIAGDLGGKTKISSESSLADVMERTATREDLSRLMRMGGDGLLFHMRLLVLRRKLRGSEKPSPYHATISHIAKVAIVCVVALGALLQFAMAIQDIEAIPGILTNVPSDILNLHPTAAFDAVGNKISDFGQRVLFGVLVACLAFVAAALIHPFGKIYRKDQLLPGERALFRLINAALRRAEDHSAQSGSQRVRRT